MKILCLNTTGAFGGAEQSLLDIIASVGAARPDWKLSLIAGGDGPLIERARELGIEATVAPMPESLAQIGDAGVDGPAGTQVGRLSLAASLARASAATAFYSRSLGRKIDAVSPTVIHTNGFKMHVLGAWAAGGKTPVVWHMHDYVSTRPVMARLMRLEARTMHRRDRQFQQRRGRSARDLPAPLRHDNRLQRGRPRSVQTRRGCRSDR